MTTLEFKSNNLLELYHLAATGSPNDLSKQLWGDIPLSFSDLQKKSNANQQSMNMIFFQENIERLRKIALDHHRRMGTLTSRVRETLDTIDVGFIDVGHQPLIMGGSSFLMNKVSLAEWIGRLTDRGVFFFIGDHDSIQNELTVTRFPQANSPSGLLITPSELNVPENTPMHKVPNPSEQWLSETKVKIQENLRMLMKYSKVKPEIRNLMYERFLNWFDLIHDSAVSTYNFSTWSQKIWSLLFNLRANLHLFLTPSSNPDYRRLISPAFEFLLTEVNRVKYIDTLNSIHEKLIDQNFQPGLPYRNPDYVPFFLECQTCKLNTRIEIKVPKAGILEGECPQCKEKYSFSYNSKSPDLSEIENSITPRSDSRAMVNNITLPLLIHIGGSGETQYYSEVIPAMKRLGVEAPILIKSNRVYYNTPWGEKSAYANNSPILDENVYQIFKQYNERKNSLNIQEPLEKMRKLLNEISVTYNTRLSDYEVELEKNPGNKKLRKNIRLIELKLSHNFGRFAAGKNIQEVSWNWLDLAIQTGVHNICSLFQRQYNENAFLGSTWYINPGKFT